MQSHKELRQSHWDFSGGRAFYGPSQKLEVDYPQEGEMPQARKICAVERFHYQLSWQVGGTNSSVLKRGCASCTICHLTPLSLCSKFQKQLHQESSLSLFLWKLNGMAYNLCQSNWSQCQNNSHHRLLLSSILDSSHYQLALFWSRDISDGVTLWAMVTFSGHGCYTYLCCGKIKQRNPERHFSGPSRHQMCSSPSLLCHNILNFS